MKTSVAIDFFVDKENKKISVRREFVAPVSKVWAAWTDNQLLDQWWAPKPWKARTKIMDFREGGYWLYAMEGPDGNRHWARADFKSIQHLKSFSTKDSFCDENGNINTDFPSAFWTNEFIESYGSTTVHIEISFNELTDLEKYLEMGFQEGFTAALENLDELFA